MAYRKTYQNHGTPYKNNQSYQPSYGPQNSPAYQQPKKHSGAKHKKYFPVSGPNKGVEQRLTSGWRLANKELISFMCVTTSKSKLSEDGWFGSIACSLTNTKSGAKAFHWGMMEEKTGKVVISDMAVVLNPKAPNGGYCGTFLK